MANVQYTHNMGHVGFQKDTVIEEETSMPPSKALGKYTNIIGAVLSVALIGGVGYWGYKLVMRDVTGIPVVRATEGDMRTRPEDPGGQLALHQGLAVNEVAAEGQASGPVDQVVLAPRQVELTDEDQPTEIEAAAPVQQPEPLKVAEAFEDGDLDALVAELTEGSVQIEASPLAEDTSAPEVEATLVQAAYTGPGLKLSLRPALRPLKAVAQPPEATQAEAAVVPVAARASSVTNLDAATLEPGTHLVQLGALDSPETARAQWDKLAAKFGDYMQGKDRVIMKATSGGRTFYRLRAHGFRDLAEARRFCSALVAEGSDCIPVVVK